MKGHENKYDWTFKDEDTYTLTIKNPTVDEEGTYNVSGHSLISAFAVDPSFQGASEAQFFPQKTNGIKKPLWQN